MTLAACWRHASELACSLRRPCFPICRAARSDDEKVQRREPAHFAPDGRFVSMAAIAYLGCETPVSDAILYFGQTRTGTGMPCFRTLMELGNKAPGFASGASISCRSTASGSRRCRFISVRQCSRSPVAAVGDVHLQFWGEFSDPIKLLAHLSENEPRGHRFEAAASWPTVLDRRATG